MSKLKTHDVASIQLCRLRACEKVGLRLLGA